MQKTLAIVCFVQLTILFSVEGVSISINPSSLVVGSSSANPVTRLELRCSSDGTSNNGIYSLEISRRRFTETGFSSLLVLDVLDGIRQDPNIPADILAKSPNVTGGLVGSPPTSGTLTLTMNGGSITCNDQAEFKCKMTYKITGITGSMTVLESNNFTVITAPNNARITDALYEENGIQNQLANDSRLNAGIRILYRCAANIGSDISLAIVWERSSMMGASTYFTTYTPPVSTDIVQDPPVQGSCSYTRMSTMYYSMTVLDDDGITFRCKLRAYLGNQWYEPISMHRRTFTNLTLRSSSSPDIKCTSTAHNATTAPLVLQRSDVECQTTSLKIFIPKNLVPGNGTVTWRDSTCVVHSNGTHFVDSVGLRDCGTTLTLEDDYVVFQNDLILHKNGTLMQNGNNIVTYGNDYEFAIPVKCVYPKNSNISTSYIPIVQQVRIMERRNGQLDLTMRQYEAEDYRHPVPFNAYPRQVPLNNDIFIRLAMENNVTGLGLSADNCFATSSPSPVDQNWYQLISSGCPVNNAKIHPSGINDVKFSFHAFNFRHNTSGIVYVHCQVSVCLDTDPACVVGCMTRKKRSASAREGAITSNLISTGPFILAADEGGEAMSTVVVAVSITVAVIATVVAIIGWTRKSKKGADS